VVAWAAGRLSAAATRRAQSCLNIAVLS